MSQKLLELWLLQADLYLLGVPPGRCYNSCSVVPCADAVVGCLVKTNHVSDSRCRSGVEVETENLPLRPTSVERWCSVVYREVFFSFLLPS